MIRKTFTDLLPLLIGMALSYGLIALADPVFSLGFGLHEVFIYHLVFSAILISLIPWVQRNPAWAPNLGYYYLGSLLLKFFVFALVFPAVVTAENIPSKEALLMLSPLFIALVCEVLFLKQVLDKMNV
jgi:hypothetical protein